MPRQARRKSESGIYHVMLRGINQQQIFEETEDYDKLIQIMNDCKEISEYELYAYCFMGNHIHLLIKEGKEPIEQIIKRIGARFVYWYNIKYQRVGHLFQDRFKSEPVENEQYFLTVLRYIHQNPVKAGLCKYVKEYRYSSYTDYFTGFELVDREFVFSLISKEKFEEFNNEFSVDKCLDIDEKVIFKVTDEQAKNIIKKVAKCSSTSDFQKLSFDLRLKFIQKIHSKGVSIRQIARLCGESKGMVEKCLKH